MGAGHHQRRSPHPTGTTWSPAQTVVAWHPRRPPGPPIRARTPGHQRKPNRRKRPRKTCGFPGGRPCAGRPDHVEHVEQASAPDVGPARIADTADHRVSAAQAPTQAQPAEHAPPTVMALPAWAPTQAGHARARCTGLGGNQFGRSRAACRERRGADAGPARRGPTPTFAARRRDPRRVARRRAVAVAGKCMAVVIPIAVVLIVAAVATISCSSSAEVKSPHRAAKPVEAPVALAEGRFGHWMACTPSSLGGPTQPNGQPFENVLGG